MTDKRVLATVPEDATLSEVCFSNDGTAVAYITPEGSRYWVANANGSRKLYDYAQHLVVGPRGDTTAHSARDQKRAFVPINGHYDQSFDWVSDPVLRSDGLSVAYWGLHQDPFLNAPGYGRYFIVLDGHLIGPFQESGHLAFNPMHGDLVYSAREDGASFMVSKGVKGPLFDHVLRPTFGPADGSVWYWGRRSDEWMLSCGNEVVCVSRSIPAWPGPFFSQNGKHVAYWRLEGGRWFVILNGSIIGTTSEIVDYVSEIVLDASGAVAYAAKDGDRVCVTVAGYRGEGFDGVGPPVFSQTSGKIGYMARRGDKEFVVVDGKQGTEFDVIWPGDGELTDYLEDVPTFRRDGVSVAYRASCGGKECVFVDNEPGDLFDSVTGTPRFSPMSDTLVYGAVDRESEYVIVGAKRSEPFERIWSPLASSGNSLLWIPSFSDDGSKLIFGALSEGQLSWRALQF